MVYITSPHSPKHTVIVTLVTCACAHTHTRNNVLPGFCMHVHIIKSVHRTHADIHIDIQTYIHISVFDIDGRLVANRDHILQLASENFVLLAQIKCLGEYKFRCY
jgi:hypothetical protein